MQRTVKINDFQTKRLPWKLREYDCEPAVNSTTSESLFRNLCSSVALLMSAHVCPELCNTEQPEEQYYWFY